LPVTTIRSKLTAAAAAVTASASAAAGAAGAVDSVAPKVTLRFASEFRIQVLTVFRLAGVAKVTSSPASPATSAAKTCGEEPKGAATVPLALRLRSVRKVQAGKMTALTDRRAAWQGVTNYRMQPGS